MYQEIYGNLIDLANEGHFDLIAQGCNCFCTQGSGIAPFFAKNFNTLDPLFYPLENLKYRGDRSKLGKFQVRQGAPLEREGRILEVANIYSQYDYFIPKNGKIALNYTALETALETLGEVYSEPVLEIGLPLIGCGLAGGDWKIVSSFIRKYLSHHKVTIVKLK